MSDEISGAAVVRRIPCPGFLMPPPRLLHAERITPAARAAMAPAWERLWFPPRDVSIAVLEDVFVASGGIVLTRDLAPVPQTLLGHGDAAVERARAVAAAQAGTLRRLRGDTLLCTKAGAAVYGHFLAELLPRAWLACQHWPAPMRFLVQAVDGRLRAIMREAFARLGIGEDACDWLGHAPVRVDRLLLVDGLSEHGGYLSPLVADCLHRISETIAPAGAARLLVLRGAAVGRRFAHEGELVARAVAAGFDVIEPAALSFAAQMARFKAARQVVGAMGSALSNIAFCAPGAAIDVLAPANMPDTFFWLLAGLRGLDHVEIRCELAGAQQGNAAWDADLRIDEADRAALLGVKRATRTGESARLGARLRALFDEAGYRRRYPDVEAAGVDPLTHYCLHGGREGRVASAAFDGVGYLRANPDVAASGINPLLHYVVYGEDEGRGW